MAILRFTPHPKQQQVLQSQEKFNVVCAGRRGGKTATQIIKLIDRCLHFPHITQGHSFSPDKMPVVLGALPTFKMARQILWKPLVKLLEGHPLVSEVNRTDFSIRFRGNRPDLIIRGTNDNDGDSLRGLKLFYAGVDEVQNVRRNTIDAVIIPALADTPNSSAIFSGTPLGTANILFDLAERTKTMPGWSFTKFHTIDNITIPAISDEVERARLILPDRLFRQEFQADFVAFSGQIFSEFNKSAHVVTKLPHFSRYWVGYDPGAVNPGLVLIGEVGEFEQFCVVEAVMPGNGSDPVLSEVCDSIILGWANLYDIQAVVLDPSRPDLRVQLQRKMNAAGKKVRCVAGKNEVKPGQDLINSLFYQNRLTILDTNKRFIGDCESYHRKTDGDGNVLDVEDPACVTHCVDGLRYVAHTLNVQSKGRVLDCG